MRNAAEPPRGAPPQIHPAAMKGGDGYRDERCHAESRWDGYARQRVLVRVCD